MNIHKREAPCLVPHEFSLWEQISSTKGATHLMPTK